MATEKQLVRELKRRQGEDSLRVFAVKVGVTAAYLSDIFAGNRAVGPKVFKYLGYSRAKTSSVIFTKVAK